MKFEGIRGLDTEIIGSQLLHKAEIDCIELREKYSPNLEPFMDKEVYGKEAVYSDLAEVLKCEARFAREDDAETKEKKRISNVFELYFVDATNTKSWFGEQTEIMRTTKYDDYFNGVDIITTFEDKDKRFDHLALSADLTFGYEASSRKLSELINDIKQNKMARMRYFHSAPMGYTGNLSEIPQTVIGLDKENLVEFIRLWTHQKDNPQLQTYRNIMLTQLVDQLALFTKVANEHHGESTIKNKYERAHNIVSAYWKNQNIDRRTLPVDAITTNIQDIIAHKRH